MLNIPYVQRRLSVVAANELGNILHTEVSIGRIDVGLLNRIIIEDVSLKDQNKVMMLKISRISARFNIRALLSGKISIGSAQLFGFSANLYKKTAESPTNFQFVIDALTSKDSTKQSRPLDLRINSLIVRRGYMYYNEWQYPKTPNSFNLKHLSLSKINSTISLKALRKDTLNANVKRLDFEEHSGLALKNLKFKVTANNRKLMMTDLTVDLPGTNIAFDTINVGYSKNTDNILPKNIHYQGRLKKSYITLGDLKVFTPALKDFDDPLYLSFKAEGDLDHLNLSLINVQTENKDIQVAANISLHNLQSPDDMSMTGQVSDLTINNTGMHFLLKNLNPQSEEEAPSILSRLGNLKFRGGIYGNRKRMSTYGLLNSGLGIVKADLNLDRISHVYEGSVVCNEVQLGTLLNQEKIGKISFMGEVSGTNGKNEKYPNCTIKGLISSIEYNTYDYKDIEVDGTLKNGGFDGLCSFHDDNLSFLLQGDFNTVQKNPQFNMTVKVDKFNPYNLHLTPQYKDTDFSFNINAKFTGNTIDNLDGSIIMDSLKMVSPEETYQIENFRIIAGQTENHQKRLMIDSDFLKADITGNYSYASMPASIQNTLQQYIPSIVKSRLSKGVNNNFTFQAQLLKADVIAKIFKVPLKLLLPVTLNGYFNDEAQKLRIEGYFPSFKIGNNRFDSGMIVCENLSDALNCKMRVAKSMAQGSMINLSLNATAQNDELKTNVSWGNNTDVTYSGELSSVTNFFKSDDQKQLLADVHIQPTEVIVNDTLWNVHPSEINIRPNDIAVHNFLFDNKDQHLQVNGNLTKSAKDSVTVDLRDISLDYIFDILNFDAVTFSGRTTGKIYVSSALKDPSADTHLTVRDFTFQGGYMGDMNIYGKWDKQQQGILLNANIAEKGISTTKVEGHIFPIKGGLDLHINADKTNLAFLNSFVSSIFSNIDGRGNGWVRVFGPFKAINLEGDVEAEVKARINVLNTPFIVRKDSIHMRPNIMTFKNVTIYDEAGHSGTVNGTVRHNALHNMRYAFDLRSNGLLCYSTKSFGDMPFYGDVYGTGTASLVGGDSGLNINISMTTNAKTMFVYNAASPDEITSQQFITFNNISPKREENDFTFDFTDEGNAQNTTKKNDDTEMDIRINMLVDATPDATLKVIMDQTSGDNITCHGRGNIQASYYNKGDFRMFGDYNITQGVYKLSMQEVIRKDFQLRQGSVVTFSGNPYNADLDVQASYTVNNASLSDLSATTGFNQNNVKVNCLMNLTGKLMRPIIRFDIELPSVNEEERDLVKSLISTNEEMNMQIIYLLGVGRFYTYDYARNNGTDSSSAMSSLLSSTLSGQLNNILGQVINSNNWNFGTNLSTGTYGWTDVEWENMLSGRLLNNRLLVNGVFGYKENTLKNSNFVGDFDVEYLLTPSGEISLKGYNETNDRYFSQKTLTTQGVGIMFKKEFQNWKDLFNWTRKKKKEEKDKKDSTQTIENRAQNNSELIHWNEVK